MPTNVLTVFGVVAAIIFIAAVGYALHRAVPRIRNRANRVTLGTIKGGIVTGSISPEKTPSWLASLQRWAEAIDPLAVGPFACNASPPASKQEVAELEAETGRRIPEVIRRFLLEQASEVNFYWFLEDDARRDVPANACRGSIEFGIETIRSFNRSRLADIFKDEEVEAIRERWGRAFEFVGVANGDQIALDLYEDPESPPVIYLNHEEPDLHIRLAESFDQFIEAWFSLGCVGPESWILRHFMTDNGEPLPPGTDGTPTSKIDPNCPNAKAFRAYFGL